MIFKGHGAEVELRQDGLTIRRRGVGSFLTQGLKGEKRIPFASISAVQFKEAGFTAGYIQFSLLGGIESRGGVFAATADENTVMFTKEQGASFAQLRDLVEKAAADSRRSRGGPVAGVSVAEELAKLADLRDRGVLSEDEFEEQKQSILGSGTRAVPIEVASSTLPPSAASPPEGASPKKGGLGKSLLGCVGLLVLIIVGLSAIGSVVETQSSNDAEVVSK